MFSKVVYAQDPAITERMERAYQEYAERIATELEPEEADEIFEEIESIRDNPFHFQSVTPEDFTRLPFLDADMITKIYSRIGHLDGTITGLQSVAAAGIDEDILYLLLNFLSFEPISREPVPRYKPSGSIRSRLASDIQNRRGYVDGSYRGSKIVSYQRILINTGRRFDTGLLAAKSAGEKSYSERISGYLRLVGAGGRVRLIFGDFRIRAGTGLMLWSGFGFSKGGQNTASVTRSGSGISPALSSTDDSKFRGGSVEFDFSRVRGSVFYSFMPRHAVIQEDGSIRNITGSAIFRTVSEMNRRNTLRERMYGYSITVRIDRSTEIGASMYRLAFNRPFRPLLPNRLSGYVDTHASVDLRSRFGSISMSGGMTMAFSTMSPSLLAGIHVRLSPGIETGIIYRRYPQAYTSYYGFAFGERRGAPEDEEGVYIGLRLRSRSRVIFEAYGDLFKFRNLGKQPGLPTYGIDYMIRVIMPLPERGNIEIRYRKKEREEFINEDTEISFHRVSTVQSRETLRGTVTILPHKRFRFIIRLESATAVMGTGGLYHSGILTYSNIRWQPVRAFTLETRYTFFDTDSYESRLYVFEYDAPGRLRSVLLNGQGSFVSIALRILAGRLTISAKYSEIFYSDRKNIGSGSQQIDNTVSGFILGQIDIRF
jgi:hypothetical protein